MGETGDSGEGDGPAGDDWRTDNRAFWDERVPIHVASDFYGNDSFVAGRTSLRPFEVDEVGAVDGRSLVHLQCHFGQDTLSWARLGATVSGLDFSEPAVVEARRLAERIGVDATFVVADVYDAVAALGHRCFDVVYSGLGAISWLPDVRRWAEVAAELVAPGGILYLAEFHPIADVFGAEDLTITWPYFRGVVVDDFDGSYTDGAEGVVHTRIHDWTHGLGDVVTAIIEAGLTIELLHEHDHTLFARWPFLVRHDDGTYHVPPGMPSLPLMYSLRARKSGS